MPQRRKPARLWLDEAKGRWLILDGTARVNTGCGPGEGGEAQQQLIRYVERRVVPELTGKAAKRRPAERVSCAEVIDYYLAKKEGEVARPRELGQRAKRLLRYWGDRMLDDVDADSCDDFAEEVGSPSYARRMLADFQAAINLYRRAGFLREEVLVTLPAAPSAREDWLTHEEAKALARVMWREELHGEHIWRHLVPYLAVSIVTCSRASRVYRASYVAEKGRPFMNLETGLYRRMWSGEKATKKRAPDLRVDGRLLRAMRRWASDRVVAGVEVEGDRFVCQYEGRAADPRRAFNSALAKARVAYPRLFVRDDGEPKHIVRHSLRHTGITWMALAGIDPYEIIRYAGITMKVFETVYAHAYPGGMKAIAAYQSKAAKALE